MTVSNLNAPYPAEIDLFAVMGLSFEILARYGWFISIVETPTETSFSAATCFLKKQIGEGDQIMAAHYRSLLDDIHKEVETAFPLRGKILSKAFEAHRRKNYELSIPVILAQADGIGEEIFGKNISPTSRRPDKIKKRKNIIEAKMDAVTKTVLGHYFSLQTLLLPINAGLSERAKFISPLNRHAILHGIDIDYATEINALKAASWLQYVVSLK